MSTGVLPIKTAARLELTSDPFYIAPRRLAHARQLQRHGHTITEIAAKLGLGRGVVTANLYWRVAYPEGVL
jgi:hypothetical protein